MRLFLSVDLGNALGAFLSFTIGFTPRRCNLGRLGVFFGSVALSVREEGAVGGCTILGFVDTATVALHAKLPYCLYWCKKFHSIGLMFFLTDSL